MTKPLQLIVYIVVAIVVLFLAFGIRAFVDYKVQTLKNEALFLEHQQIKAFAKRLIDAKQESSKAITIALSHNKHIAQHINNPTPLLKKELEAIARDIINNTQYESFWVQIIDKHGISLSRSWVDKHMDDLTLIRADIAKLIKTPMISTDISTGWFSMSFKSTAPIYDKSDQFIGLVDTVTHFESIGAMLKQNGINSVLIADKRYKERLKANSQTNHFIDDYYVVDTHPNSAILKLIDKHSLQGLLFMPHYEVLNNTLLTVLPVVDNLHQNVGYYLLQKPLSDLSFEKIEHFTHTLRVMLVVALGFILMGVVFYFHRKQLLQRQKRYYKEIIDSSLDIIVVIKEGQMIDANRAFFEFFHQYATLKAFKKAHGSLCDTFVHQTGFLQKRIDNVSWLEYILRNQGKFFRAKIYKEKRAHIFSVRANVLNNTQKHIYTVVLTDITDAEAYKEKLKKISVTDALTNIGNRLYFTKELNKLLNKMPQQNNAFSLIMIDIDHFKEINDTHGHDVGDDVLKALTKAVSNLLDAHDIFARFGGEEFIIVLPHANAQTALQKAQHIRKSVQYHHSDTLPNITISLGVTAYIENDTQDSLLKRADEALYEAKNSGRNKAILRL